MEMNGINKMEWNGMGHLNVEWTSIRADEQKLKLSNVTQFMADARENAEKCCGRRYHCVL